MAGPVRQPIDIPSLEQYVGTYVPFIRAPLELKQFGFGYSNPTYQIIDAKGMKYVMRKKPPGTLVNKSAHQVEREFRIIRALEKTDVPVPKAYILCEDVAVIGTAFYIMEFIDGRVITENHIPQVSPEERTEMWRDAIRTLVKFHEVDYRKVGLEGFGKSTGFYDRQIKTYTAIAKTQAKVLDIETGEPVGEIPHVDEMIEFFKTCQPEDRTTLVHGDYKLDNLIFHKTEPRVVGVLDWELATVGHPLSDFANLMGPWPMVGVSKTPEFVPGAVPGLPTLEECIGWYKSSGYDVGRDLPWGTAFFLFRGCVNLQGIAMRYARRQASSAYARDITANRMESAESAWKTIQKLQRQYLSAFNARL